MNNEDLQQKILNAAKAHGWLIATAESCTGGMVAARLTDLPGSSQAVAGGIVTYSNAMKMALLDVPESCLNTSGAVSDETVHAMALGCLKKTQAHLVVSISGIAGPDGGSPGKPIGTVHFGVLSEDDNYAKCTKVIFDGNRQDIREQATDFALTLLAEKLAEKQGRST